MLVLTPNPLFFSQSSVYAVFYRGQSEEGDRQSHGLILLAVYEA